MDAGLRTPLLDSFRRPDVPLELRVSAAEGQIAPRGLEQLALLMWLADDDDLSVKAAAERTLDSLPPITIGMVLGRSDAPPEMVRFFAGRGIEPRAKPAASPGVDGAAGDADADGPVVDADDGTAWDVIDDAAPDGDDGRDDNQQSITQQIQQMNIVQRVRAAMKGSREMRALLIRDPNRMVAAAVLSSPKLTAAEVEAFAKMANVSEDVLRAIAQNRAWVKSYGVAHALTRNPKMPVALSMGLLQRLVDRDIRAIAIDRNVPEPLRMAARRRVANAQSR